MDWAQVLVIILSIFLAIFLLLGIILTVMLIKVTKQIKSITESAGRTINGFEKIIDKASAFTSPVYLAKTIFDQVQKAKKKVSKKEKEQNDTN